jgi:alpha-beta hydrolase superfamily lysophospholipase
VPTLLMNGDKDEWVRVDEARAIFDALKGPKRLQFFPGVGHDSSLRRLPDEWRRVVGGFLAEHGMETAIANAPTVGTARGSVVSQ